MQQEKSTRGRHYMNLSIQQMKHELIKNKELNSTKENNLDCKIFKEIIKEEEEISHDQLEHRTSNVGEYIESLGLACNLEGIKAP